MVSTVFELPQDCTPLQLLQALREHAQPRSHLRLGQWGIHVDEHGAWLTNPYGGLLVFSAISDGTKS